jgi:hypothetical protein
MGATAVPRMRRPTTRRTRRSGSPAPHVTVGSTCSEVTKAKELSPEWSDLAAAHGAALVDLAKAVRDSKALSGLRPLA